MMWLFASDAGNWAVARLLDSAARGDRMPGWAAEAGWVLIGLAVAVSVWLAVRWWRQRREERTCPEPGNLLDARPWLAIDPYTVEPTRQLFYRGKRRAPRNHVMPAHLPRAVESVTELIPKVADDPEATAVLVRPRGRWGAR